MVRDAMSFRAEIRLLIVRPIQLQVLPLLYVEVPLAPGAHYLPLVLSGGRYL
jgi:hypothetical protein